MALSDDALQAIAAAVGNDDPDAQPFFLTVADRALAATLPDGRTLADAIDKGAVALRLLAWIASIGARPRRDFARFDFNEEDGGRYVTLADVSPPAAALLAHLEATP